MKRRVQELIKDVVIVVLAVSLIVLAVLSLPAQSIRKSPFLSSLLQPLASLLGLEEAELAYLEVKEPVMDAALPLAISVNTETGRSTAIWDFDALDSAFETLGGALGQALDTAQTPEISSRSDLRTALQGESVYFSYDLRLPAAGTGLVAGRRAGGGAAPGGRLRPGDRGRGGGALPGGRHGAEGRHRPLRRDPLAAPCAVSPRRLGLCL